MERKENFQHFEVPFLAIILALTLPLMGQESATVVAARNHFLTGNHAQCLELARLANPAQADFPALASLEIRSLLETGLYQEAAVRGRQLSRRASDDAELSMAFAEAVRASGDAAQATAIIENATAFMPGPADEGNSRLVVAYGELLLASHIDGKQVLDHFLEPAKKAAPKSRHAYLAIGRLALANHDRELAAENFREGLKHFPGDPEFTFGMELGGLPLPESQQAEGIDSFLDLALKANPRFTAALLYKANQLGGRKNFKAARETLRQILTINEHQPEAWAQLAALALIEDDEKTARAAMERARKFHHQNPRVSEIIGVTLADHYRFKEAIGHLQQAAEEDPSSSGILFELGSNQLRFGQLEQGWKNVALAHQKDPYNVAAFNLTTLGDKLRNYPVREKEGVRLRMSPEDMAVFGSRALDLAVKAKQTLAEKYQIALSQPVMVEMLPRQEDFAIRTFGLPGGESFLGVCFGPLITMTSPRGRLGRANWESVLWHEMAHTITLEATRHRIPRWLTEGISVHEERQVLPGWGQGMNSDFRSRFLTEKLLPISRLDEAFAGPDIMFGYYHSSLVVDFIMGKFGIGAMRSVLADLSIGKPPELALAAHTLPPDELESGFLTYAKQVARSYGPDLDWTPLSDDECNVYLSEPNAWLAANPKRYAAAMMWCSKLVENKEWKSAKTLLEKIISAEPNNREANNPYQILASVCRALNDDAGERSALTKLLEIDSNNSDASARLLELSGTLAAPARLAAAEKMLETNPFKEQAYRTLVGAAKELRNPDQTRIASLSLLALKPPDASRLHYELATQLRESAPEEARRHVLKALEENPRFELALEFLIRLPPPP